MTSLCGFTQREFVTRLRRRPHIPVWEGCGGATDPRGGAPLQEKESHDIHPIEKG